ncbi:HIT zinc finger [Aspergillus terreus]|uniref:HIT zinc finger n=1 Tax=Aspergillus terreus TaxID=33178 RepID=A0A5M3YZQ9_ASPTE|nr:hypothetical protein ATETN484_0004069300 [Aspergillus terreus]GFF13761.1 HIT zinc finger [Aspergillus terreus]
MMAGPADELIDENRRKLINELASVLGNPTINSGTWTCLWFADIERLQHLLDRCIVDHDFAGFVFGKLEGSKPSEMLKTWGARSDQDSDEESNVNTSSGKGKANDCRERYNSTCLVTGFREPIKVAHIYPHYMGEKSETEQKTFWRTLRHFWSPAKVALWKEEILGPQGTENCANLLTLSNITQKLWEKARFALRPMYAHETMMWLQFFWLPRLKYIKSLLLTQMPPLFAPDLTSSDFEVNHPLPSIKLLRLQWTLHRVLAMSGVAEASDEDLDLFAGMGTGWVTGGWLGHVGGYEEMSDDETGDEETVDDEKGEEVELKEA